MENVAYYRNCLPTLRSEDTEQETTAGFIVLDNLAVMTQRKVDDMKQEPKKNPEESGRVNEPEVKCSTPVEEFAWAREVVQTAITAENPFRNYPTITHSEDFEAHKPNEKTSVELVVQRKDADRTEPQSKQNTPIEEPVPVENVVQKQESPIVLSTRDSQSISPVVCRPIKELVMTKQATYPDRAATTAVVEERGNKQETETFMAKVARRTDDLIVAGKVDSEEASVNFSVETPTLLPIRIPIQLPPFPFVRIRA